MASQLTGPLQAASALLALLQIALAVAIAVVIRQVLWSSNGSSWFWSSSFWGKTSAENVCLLTTYASFNLCALFYVVVGVGLAASAAALLVQCCTRSSRRSACCCASLDLFLATLLGLLWFAVAITATVYGVRADGAGMPKHSARTAVWAMAWAEAFLWGLSAMAALASRRAARGMSETELSASLAGASGRFQRYEDTPFTDRTSKWREVRAAYLAKGGVTPTRLSKQMEDVDPRFQP